MEQTKIMSGGTNVEVIVVIYGLALDLDEVVNFGSFQIIHGTSFCSQFVGETLRKDLGSWELKTISKSSIIYYNGPIRNFFLKANDLYDIGQLAEITNDHLSLLFKSIWHECENSIKIERVYVISGADVVQTNNMSSISNSQGDFSLVKLPNDIWDRVCKFHNLRVKILNNSPLKGLNKGQAFESYESGVINYSRSVDVHYYFSKLFLAYYFLDLIRYQQLSVMKIAFNMSLFECLFSTSDSFVNRQIKERMLSFLGEKAKKEEIIDLLKDCYYVRSRFFHGDSLNLKFTPDYLRKMCSELDNLNRILFNEIVVKESIFEKSKKEFEMLFPVVFPDTTSMFFDSNGYQIHHGDKVNLKSKNDFLKRRMKYAEIVWDNKNGCYCYRLKSGSKKTFHKILWFSKII